MKIFVKTLKGDRFEIQVNLEDSVADVKKKIETVLGVTAEEQMLIHKGKVLKDETTLEANNVSEKSIIGVIKRKPASTATSTSTETPTERASAGASYVASERVSESSIQKILGMVGGGWDRYMVTSALYLAYDDVDKALEYLYFELPGQSEDPYIAEGTQDQTQEHEAPTEADELRFFDFLNDTPEQEYLRALARSDPSIIKDFVEMLEEQDPPLFVLIQDNKALFLRLLLEVEGGACGNEMDQPHEHQVVQTNEPDNGGDGDNQVGGESEETKVEELQADQTNKPNNGVDGGNQVVGESEETKVEVANPEDNELIEQVCLISEVCYRLRSSKQSLAGYLELESFLSSVKEKMKIFVKTLKGARFEIQVKPDDSVHAAHPSSTATETPVTPTEPAWDAASNGNYESISESNIQQILEMVRGAWSREAVAYALCLAYNDLDKALEYIYFGIPVQSEDHYTTEEQTQEPEETDLEWSLDSLRHTPEFEYLRPLVQSDPSLLMDFLLMLKKQNPPFFRLIQDNKADFLRLLLEQPQEPNNGGDSGNQVGESEETKVEELQADKTNNPNNEGDGGNQVGESKDTEVEVATPEDYELIERLEALGFERGDAAVAYFACNRNVQVAANHLLGYKHESRRE
ncbi:hypothetical protein Bca4012_046086 [Brassica carinata]|uniref:DNA repair protein RAD23 n=1 Tax=Brassica carinata TaxID=52824 RepID=A0A8X7QQC9_BRACI|nr:hypothetical protein Bca52824_056377 [Brassica carinata]